MGKYICKLEDMYFEWSTIVDAPITFGMTKEEFLIYYKATNSVEWVNELLYKLNKVDEKGVSTDCYGSIDELISYNRAGKNEECLTKEELIEYLRNGVDWEE